MHDKAGTQEAQGDGMEEHVRKKVIYGRLIRRISGITKTTKSRINVQEIGENYNEKGSI